MIESESVYETIFKTNETKTLYKKFVDIFSDHI